jgi:ADP-heptose:LPS heptosyltransferase
MTHSKLLIIHQGALGDVVLTFPAIIALRKKFGRIDMLCQSQLGNLAAKLGLIEKWYPLEAAYFSSLFSDQIDRKIKDLICSYTTILVFSFSCDLKKSISQITDSQCFQIRPRPPAQDKIHVTEFLFKNLIDGGLLEATDSNYEISNLQRKQNHRTGRPIDVSKILIHPGSGSIRKRWPLTQFLKLADVLKKKGLQSQFVCGPAEPDLKADLQNQNRNVQSLSELTGLVDLLQSAGAFIGNDSGVSQLAGFLGQPTVVIFGPSDPVRWAPLGPHVQIVRPELNCNPCFEIEPENCPEPKCATDAKLDSVLKAFYRVYKIG